MTKFEWVITISIILLSLRLRYEFSKMQKSLDDKDEYIRFLKEKNLIHNARWEAKKYESEDLQLLEDIENGLGMDI